MELKQFFLNILRFGAVAGAGAAKMGRHGVASFLTFSKIYTIPNSFIKIFSDITRSVHNFDNKIMHQIFSDF